FSRTLALDGSPGFSALEIQARYLETARRYVDLHRAGDAEAHQVLEAWQEVLQLLATDPFALSDRLDWVAKKDLMQEALDDAGLPGDHGWDQLARALPAIKFMEERNVGLGRSVDRADEVRRWVTARLGDDAPALEQRLRDAGLR